MFELTIAFRYLVPKKKALSTALISFLSIIVISLVVWLVLVFLSVTSGIERSWLQKLTSLHSPVRLTPTEHYYQSYYYQADSLSAASGYTLKTIGEKAESPTSEPYSDLTDAQTPSHWPAPDRHADGKLRDLVKETTALLAQLNCPFQDYEISGALLRLSLSRPSANAGAGATLSQMSYLLSFMDMNPRFASLIVPPSVEDLDSMLKKARDANALEAIFNNIRIQEIAVSSIDPLHLPENTGFLAFASPVNEVVLLPLQNQTIAPQGWLRGHLVRHGHLWQWTADTGKVINQPDISLDKPLHLQASILSMAPDLTHVRILAKGQIQDKPIACKMNWGGATLSRAEPRIQFDRQPNISPPWAICWNNRCHLPLFAQAQPVLIPKAYRDMGVRMGDWGTLNFSSVGAASSQEQRINVQIAGFYDPGLFSMGGRCLIVPQSITRTIHAASQTFSPDGTPTNGIGIFCDHDEETLKQKIEEGLQKADLSPYWKVSTFKDYEFSKELFQQFRSDRTLFMLIALLILLVACCNIISLLVLLVNDKKREIAILQSMGASWRSVAAIFATCGLAMGAFSSLIGTAAAIFTLHHLDVVVGFLSALQGHAAFQPAFFGQSLPNELSHEALLFVLIATPLLSLLAGLVPALKASRIRPAPALRQE